MNDEPWVDTIVPFQILAVGNVGIVASSFEQTTMQGRCVHQVLKVARSLVQGTYLSSGPTPPDLLDDQVVHTWIDSVGVMNDSPPDGFSFGSVFTYFEVQRQSGATWATVATDGDPYTRFFWERIGDSRSPESQVVVQWDLDEATSGTYRIVHHGVAKWSLLGVLPQYVAFMGTSASFVVR